MLLCHYHSPGTTFVHPMYSNNFGTQHVGGGVVICPFESARPITKKFYGSDDVIRTSLPLDRFGNKSCYHDRAVGELYLSESDILRGSILSPHFRELLRWYDYDSLLQRLSDPEFYRGQAIVQGEPLGFGVFSPNLSAEHGCEYTASNNLDKIYGTSYCANAYSRETITFHYFNGGMEVRACWLLGGEIPVGIQIHRPQRVGQQTGIALTVMVRGKSDKVYTYRAMNLKIHPYTNKYTLVSMGSTAPRVSESAFSDFLTKYHPHYVTENWKKVSYSKAEVALELITMMYAVLGSPELRKIEDDIMPCWDGVKFTVQTASVSSSAHTTDWWLSSAYDEIGATGEITRLTTEQKHEINREISLFNSVAIPTEPPVPWGDLGNECADQVSITDVNVLGYLAGLKEVGGTAKSLYKFLQDPKAVRKGAEAYLSARFGDRLTVSDTKTIFDDITGHLVDGLSNKVIPTRTRRHTTVDSANLFYPITSQTCVQTYHAWFAPNDYIGFDRAVSTLMQLGLWLDTKNAWDLVPLSFVVDWFVNVSEFFESIDRWVTNRYFSVISVMRSVRYETIMDPSLWTSKYPFLTSVSHVRYFREVTHRLDSTPFCIDWSTPNLVNVLDGAALLIQR